MFSLLIFSFFSTVEGSGKVVSLEQGERLCLLFNFWVSQNLQCGVFLLSIKTFWDKYKFLGVHSQIQSVRWQKQGRIIKFNNLRPFGDIKIFLRFLLDVDLLQSDLSWVSYCFNSSTLIPTVPFTTLIAHSQQNFKNSLSQCRSSFCCCTEVSFSKRLSVCKFFSLIVNFCNFCL